MSEPSTPHEAPKHLVFFERAGDARLAFKRFQAGGEEYYHGERRTVQLKIDLARRFGRATVITAVGKPWDEPLTDDLRSVGLGGSPENFESAAFAWLRDNPPTHMILGPELSVLEWAADHGISVLPNFAHTFFNPPATSNPVLWLRRRVGRWIGLRRFARALRRLDPERLLNHNEVAAADLRRLAPRPERVCAIEMMDLTPLENRRERSLSAGGQRTVFYCGRTSVEKGFHDLVAACGMLLREGLDLKLTVCGGADPADMAKLAQNHGLGDRLDWRGACVRSEVQRLLDASTVAVVPSRLLYPEGMPLTLFEPLGMGVPLVASNHRAWARLRDGEEFLVHRAGDPASLASALRRALTDADLYATLSRMGPAAFRRIRSADMLVDQQRAWAKEVLARGRATPAG